MKMSPTENRSLTQIKKDLEDAKTKKAQIDGKLEQAYERMKREFKITDLTAGDKALDTMQKDLAELDDKISTSMQEVAEVLK
jgi:hypothetical protein